MLQGNLDANRLEIIDSGDRILFENGVRMMLMLTEGAANQSGETRAGPPGAANAAAATPAKGAHRP